MLFDIVIDVFTPKREVCRILKGCLVLSPHEHLEPKLRWHPTWWLTREATSVQFLGKPMRYDLQLLHDKKVLGRLVCRVVVHE